MKEKIKIPTLQYYYQSGNLMNNKKVWIVDDDKSIRWVLEKALQSSDIDIETSRQEDISLSQPSELIPEELQETNLNNLDDLWGDYEAADTDTVGTPLSLFPPPLPASYDTTGTGIDLNLELDED